MSSIIEGYNYDIFISYRQKDNKYDGWVTEFVDNFKKELEATFKEDVSVYFDINPHDGLLETYDVDASLKDKLKCLVFIPIISRTYCDPKSFAWEHEFKAFVDKASQDQFGLKVKLPNGNVANRVLPVRIHDLDTNDIKLCETALGGVLRGVEFIYKSAGVNRSLRSQEDNPHDNLNRTIYRDQINKVALAIRDIIEGAQSSATQIGDEQLKVHLEEQKEKNENIGKMPVVRKIFKSIQKQSMESDLPPKTRKLTKRILIISSVLTLLALSFFCIVFLFNKSKRNYSKYELIPKIQKLVDENFTPPFQAFELANEAQKYLTDDSLLNSLWPRISESISLSTKPDGAMVSWKDYNLPQNPWEIIGLTPFKDVKVPLGYKRIKIEKNGFQTIYLTSFNLIGTDPDRFVRLDTVGILPYNMVRIPSRIAPRSNMGRVKYAGKYVGEFLIDRFETANKDYKRFIDSGGYSNKSYWKFPIYKDGKEISWETAMELFIDKTGKRGPSGWEVGNYPEGQDDYPVSGVSWYEANAFAFFEGKRLPTIYHWSVIAETNSSANIIPLSNFNGKSTVPVGKMEGMCSYGIYDLAGNVREWCYNGNGERGENYIVGGGYNDPLYSFNGAGTQPSIDRSISNGFRCMKVIPGDTTLNYLIADITQPSNDYYKEKPVDENTFKIFLRQYEYDKIPLNIQIIKLVENDIWKVEKASIDVGYGNERIDIYLFIPKSFNPPYQPILYFPGSNAISTSKFDISSQQRIDFIVKSGRVLVYPILKGTFERRDGLNSDLQEETVFYKDHVIMWRKDFGRTIDYLETRDDILHEKIGYFGWSWGGFMGGLIPAIEKRIKAVVLHVGGIDRNKAYPEADQLNFVPRVYQPVLMLNGKYDMYFPEETSQKPMFNLLGTPSKDKKILVYDTGHLVPRNDLIKETLAWFDKYLGPVN
jgi:hypothetical protein